MFSCPVLLSGVRSCGFGRGGVQFCFLGFAIALVGVSSFACGGLQLSLLGCSVVILGFSSCPAGGVLFCFLGFAIIFLGGCPVVLLAICNCCSEILEGGSGGLSQ